MQEINILGSLLHRLMIVSTLVILSVRHHLIKAEDHPTAEESNHYLTPDKAEMCRMFPDTRTISLLPGYRIAYKCILLQFKISTMSQYVEYPGS